MCKHACGMIRNMKIGNRVFDEGHTYIMGILNVTPDSFSDGGKYNRLDSALKHIEEMIADGADVIDIGGESTRPGYEHISVQDEIERVVPVIEAASGRFDIPISIDTYKPDVAGEAVLAGATLVNDIWGLRGEDFKTENLGMAEVVAQNKVSCCIMQNYIMEKLETAKQEASKVQITDKDQDNPSGRSGDGIEGSRGLKAQTSGIRTDDRFLAKGMGIASEIVIDGLNKSIKIAAEAGIDRERILLDPGIGFGKTYEDNLEVLKNLKAIKEAFEYPMLLGTSRKSVIGLTLNLPSSERVEGTLATTARAIEAGCLFVRVHDVKENARFIKMYEALR